MLILLVEDDEMSRELWTLLLETAGYEVMAAGSGAEALQSMAAHALPDVVLMDMQMPGISGVAMAEGLRDACGDRRLVVLAMSGSEPKNLAAGGELEGFDGFLLKPFTVEALAVKVAAGGTGADGPSAAAEAGVEAEVLDLAVYSQMAASMPSAVLAEMYALCLRDARARIERMAAAGANSETVCAEAHAIKGGCAMLGADEVARLAAAIEADGRYAGTAEVTGRYASLRIACDRLEGMLVRRTKAE